MQATLQANQEAMLANQAAMLSELKNMSAALASLPRLFSGVAVGLQARAGGGFAR
jgi:hypothetical protein